MVMVSLRAIVIVGIVGIVLCGVVLTYAQLTPGIVFTWSTVFACSFALCLRAKCGSRAFAAIAAPWCLGPWFLPSVFRQAQYGIVRLICLMVIVRCGAMS